MTVNFTKHQEEITLAWRQVIDSREEPRWVLFGYEGSTNNIKLMSTGSHGLKELVQEFNCSLIQYALCRIIDKALSLNKLVLINWQGDASPLSRKGICASHVGDVANYFKGCSQTITIRNDDEATPEYLMEQVLKTSNSYVTLTRDKKMGGVVKPLVDDGDSSSPIGSTYKKTDIKSELSIGDDRKSFWARQEEEEKKRLEDEKKRAIEKQAQFERERKSREEFEAKKLAEATKKRDEMIQATRQAEKLESSNSGNYTSISASQRRGQDDDIDERVGRRSELIRLERNQETHSLISKGLIKNKRAIFEQASQQQQSTTNQPMSISSTRNPSGTLVSKRVNSFKSMNCRLDDASVDKLSNNLKKNLNTHKDNLIKTNVVKMEIEAIHTIKDEVKEQVAKPQVAICTTTTNEIPTISNHKEKPIVESSNHVSNGEKLNQVEQLDKNSNNLKEQPNSVVVVDNHSIEQPLKQPISNDFIAKSESNGTFTVLNEKISPKKDISSPIKEHKDEENNGDVGITAKALYDYQAADNTEISFDPDDVIGFIQKVDEGWWHGSVISGQFKGQSGLFPANYVEELKK